MAKQEVSLKSKKKKKWCQVLAPSVMNNIILGETLIYAPTQMLSRTLQSNLMNLTGDMKKQHINIKFKVIEVKGDTAITEPIVFEIVPTSVKRLVRRGRDRIDDSMLCITKDNRAVRIKPMLLTKTNSVTSKLKLLRKNMKAFLKPYVRRRDYMDLFVELIDHKLQNELRSYLKKIYPLKSCEIRYFNAQKIREEELMKMKQYVAPEEIKPNKSEGKTEEKQEETTTEKAEEETTEETEVETAESTKEEAKDQEA